MPFVLLLLLNLSFGHATPPRGSTVARCVNFLTGVTRFKPLDARGWRGLDEPEAYAGLVTAQWDQWDEDLRVEGKVPVDLDGTYVRVGPLGFDSLGRERKRSMIDSAGGLARVYDLKHRRVRVRRVETEALLTELAAGRFVYPSISTLVPGRFNFAGRMQNQASVAMYPRAGQWIVTDELRKPVGLRSNDLLTEGEVTLDPTAPDAKYLAHAKRDPRTGHWCHFQFSIGQDTAGRVICLNAAGAVHWRSEPFKIPSLGGLFGSPYIHDWGFTENYIVLYLQPYLFSIPGLIGAAAGVIPMMDALYTQPKLNAKIAVISREDSSLKALVDTGESAMTWHFVNGFDAGGEVTLDVTSTQIVKKARGLGDSMRLPILGKPLPHRPDGCFLKRIRLNVAQSRLLENKVLLDDANYEFPAVAPSVQGKPHRYTYLGRCHGARPWFTGVAKYDYATHTNVRFEFEPHEFAGEPMFAPRQGGVDEDDGYVLIEVYDGRVKRSALVVFDARKVAAGPVARLWLSRHLPFGFHGLWVE